jgi:hypothetical protein
MVISPAFDGFVIKYGTAVIVPNANCNSIVDIKNGDGDVRIVVQAIAQLATTA